MTDNQRLKKFHADLFWAVTSPDLMADFTGLSKQDTTIDSITLAPHFTDLKRSLLQQLKIDELPAYLQTPKFRLGVYFEKLWHFMLENYPGVDLLAHNLPVTNNSRTLGEFDFIYYCHNRKRPVHLEVAVKFYLGLESNGDELNGENNWHHWVGPGGKDRLDIKLLRMLNHQCQLSQTPDGQAMLATLGIDNIEAIVQEICLKGYFFYPLSGTCREPVSANQQHLSGFWARLGQLKNPESELHNYQWLILPKMSWFSPECNHDKTQQLSLNMLCEQVNHRFETNPFPIMVQATSDRTQLKGERTSASLRGFIVPDNWQMNVT
jgi:hypothetical protein